MYASVNKLVSVSLLIDFFTVLAPVPVHMLEANKLVSVLVLVTKPMDMLEAIKLVSILVLVTKPVHMLEAKPINLFLV